MKYIFGTKSSHGEPILLQSIHLDLERTASDCVPVAGDQQEGFDMPDEPDMFEFFLNQINQGMFDHAEQKGSYKVSGMKRLIRATNIEIDNGNLTREQQKELGLQLNIRLSESGRTRRF